MFNGILLRLTSCLLFSLVAASSNIPAGGHNKCPPQFATTCNCGLLSMKKEQQSLLPFYGKLVVNCTSTQLSDISILKSTPDWAQALIFTGNDFPELPADSFGHSAGQSSSVVSFVSLETIDLSNNGIKFIYEDAFKSVKNVKKLILDNNKLVVTSGKFTPAIFSHFHSLRELSLKSAFDRDERSADFIGILTSTLNESRLTNLTYLELNDNGLPNIPERMAFCSLVSLRALSLSGNSLTSITFNVSCMPKLTDLDVSDNYISNVDSSAIACLSEKSDLQVNLVRNPLKCDCHILPFHRWLMKSKKTIQVIGESTLKCASSDLESNVDKLFAFLDENSLHCSPETLIQNEDSSPNYFTLTLTVAMSVILASLVISSVFVVLNRVSVMRLYNRVLDSMDGGQEYTCLNQDTPAPTGNLFIKYHRQASLYEHSLGEDLCDELMTSMREESV